jgi:hypothetical protein
MLTLSGVKTAAASPTEVTSAKVPAAVQADIPRTDNAAQRRVVLQEASRQQQQNDQLTLTTAAGSADIPNDSVRVSSTLGKAASSGILSREDALAIYQKIAAML